MSLSSQITEDMKTAMRGKDAGTLAVLRSLKSALKYAAIEKHGAEGELDDADATGVVRRQIKQRQDSLESFRSAGRDDLAGKEEAEIVVLERYLPAAMSDTEVEAMVDAVIAETGASSRKDMGTVMKVVQERAAGRVDNRTLSSAVAKRLS